MLCAWLWRGYYDRACTQTLHVDYIMAAANLLAFVFGLKQTRDRTEVATMATRISVAEFVPKTNVTFAETDDEYKENCKNVAVGTPLIYLVVQQHLRALYGVIRMYRP